MKPLQGFEIFSVWLGVQGVYPWLVNFALSGRFGSGMLDAGCGMVDKGFRSQVSGVGMEDGR